MEQRARARPVAPGASPVQELEPEAEPVPRQPVQLAAMQVSAAGALPVEVRLALQRERAVPPVRVPQPEQGQVPEQPP